jgi:uncharacterized protein YjbJ (UPF0337 family)
MSYDQERDLGMQGQENTFKGKMKRAVGKIQTKFGQATGNREIEMKGRAKQVEGTAQSAAGNVQQKVDDTKNRAKRNV